jgi:transposase
MVEEARRKLLENCTRMAPGRVATRAWIILLSEKGKIPSEIAAIFDCPVSTVEHWIKRYKAEGLNGLYEDPQHIGIKLVNGRLYFDIKVIEELINEAKNAPKTEMLQKILEYCAQMAPGRVATRFWIILLSEKGKTPSEIAAIFDCSVSTVRRWIKCYKAEGVEGLCNRSQQESSVWETGKPYFDTKVIEELMKRLENAPKPKKGYLIESEDGIRFIEIEDE